jgi:hypothetical protein
MKPAEEKKLWQTISESRFLVLFIAIVLLFALRPFLEGSLDKLILTGIFFFLALLGCIYAVSETRGQFLFALILGLPSVLAHWVGVIWGIPSLGPVAAILQIIFWGYILTGIMSHLFRVKEVTADTIMGAACAYFLIGLAWSFMFFLLEFDSPGSFSFPPPKGGSIEDFIYYSFVTLTTLGFGDITPVSHLARSLTVLEAVLGQLFMATTIAILVGSYLSRSGKSSSD